jgi:hypothetical protein
LLYQEQVLLALQHQQLEHRRLNLPALHAHMLSQQLRVETAELVTFSVTLTSFVTTLFTTLVLLLVVLVVRLQLVVGTSVLALAAQCVEHTARVAIWKINHHRLNLI